MYIINPYRFGSRWSANGGILTPHDNNLVAAYNFTEDAFRYDAKQSNTLQNYNGVTNTASGQDGYRAEFAGASSQYFKVRDTTDFDMAEGTIFCWAYMSSATNFPYLAHKRIGVTDNYNFTLHFNPAASRIDAKINDGSNNPAVASDADIAASNWYAVMFTWDATYLKLYVGGNQEGGDISNTASSYTGNGHFYIGAFEDTSSVRNFMYGYIDAMYIWNTALGQTEATALAAGSYFSNNLTTYGSAYFLRTTNHEKFHFDTEISSTVSSSLGTQSATAGAQSATVGFALGGYSGGAISKIEGITFSDESDNDPAATLSLARYAGGGVNSEIYGYLLGGITSVNVTEVDGIKWDDNSAHDPAVTLSLARRYCTGISSATRGIAMGGYTNTRVTEIDGLTFSGEASYDPAAVLDTEKADSAGCSSSTKGYVMGGRDNTSVTDDIQSINYSTEAIATLGATLTVARRYTQGGCSTIVGIAMGGDTGSASNEIDGITFSTEASYDPAATLGIAFSTRCVVSS